VKPGTLPREIPRLAGESARLRDDAAEWRTVTNKYGQ